MQVLHFGVFKAYKIGQVLFFNNGHFYWLSVVFLMKKALEKRWIKLTNHNDHIDQAYTELAVRAQCS